MDDMMASMLGGIADLDARLASLKSSKETDENAPSVEEVKKSADSNPTTISNTLEDADSAENAADPTDATSVATLSSNPADAYYSDLQPFTYILADGTIGTLFGASTTSYIVPEGLDKTRIRSPDKIVGPAVVSHDNTWRSIEDASLFAATVPKDEIVGSDTEC